MVTLGLEAVLIVGLVVERDDRSVGGRVRDGAGRHDHVGRLRGVVGALQRALLLAANSVCRFVAVEENEFDFIFNFMPIIQHINRFYRFLRFLSQMIDVKPKLQIWVFGSSRGVKLPPP